MKATFLMFVLLVIAAESRGGEFVREVAQPLQGAYIPQGFDTNDTIEIMVTGKLRNSCARIGAEGTQLDESKRVISVTLSSYEYSGKCLETEIPFFFPVYIGMLRTAGDYAVRDAVSQRVLGWVRVAKAPKSGSGVDDVVYPLLTDAFVLSAQGRRVLVLKGLLPADCVTLGETRLEVQPNVLVAVPSLVRTADRQCRRGTFPFTKTVELRRALPKGLFLLHVRSMGGRSIQKMISEP